MNGILKQGPFRCDGLGSTMRGADRYTLTTSTPLLKTVSADDSRCFEVYSASSIRVGHRCLLDYLTPKALIEASSKRDEDHLTRARYGHSHVRTT